MTESIVRLRWPEPEAFRSTETLRRAFAERAAAVEELLRDRSLRHALRSAEEAPGGRSGLGGAGFDLGRDLGRVGRRTRSERAGGHHPGDFERLREETVSEAWSAPPPMVRRVEAAGAALYVESDPEIVDGLPAERSDLVREVGKNVGFAVPTPETRLLGEGDAAGDPSAHLKRIGLPPDRTAEARAAAGAGVRVSVIDSGLQADHPELRDARIDTAESYDYWHLAEPRQGVVDYIALPAGAQPEARHYHGTAVAGLVAGATTGVAPAVEVIVHNVFYRGPEREAEGLSWRDEQGVLHRPDTTILRIEPAILYSLVAKADILVLSLGTPGPNPCFSNEIGYVTTGFGGLVVAASGNSGPDTRLSPGDYAEVLTIGALGPDERPWPGTSTARIDDGDGGDRLVKPDLYAPGVDLTAPVPTTLDPAGYWRVTGTSFAAPIAAGVAALVLGRCREQGKAVTAAAVKGHLLETADDFELPPEVGGTGKRLNAARALEHLP